MTSGSARPPDRGFSIPVIAQYAAVLGTTHGAGHPVGAKAPGRILRTPDSIGVSRHFATSIPLQHGPALHTASALFPFALLLMCAITLALIAWGIRRKTCFEVKGEEDGEGARSRDSLNHTELGRQAEVRDEKALLVLFIREVPAAVAMFDRSMHYLQASDRWCENLGIKREQAIGHSHYELFPNIPERWRAIHHRCLEGQSQVSEDDLWERDDGQAMWVRWEIRPWGLQDGRPQGLLAYMDDVTERRKMERALRESEATTRTLLDTASQAIVAVDRSGQVVMMNRMAEMMFGYTRQELDGNPVESLMPERFRESHRGHRARFMENPEPRSIGLGMDLVGLRKSGEEFPIEVSLSAVPSMSGMLAVSFVSDITVRKAAERKLRENETKLHQLAGNLLSAQEEERSTLARELHDDITQRLAFLSMELGRVPGELPGPAQEHLRSLREQIRRLSTEVHRLSRGLHPSVIADFGLSAALEEFCEDFQRARGVSVVFESPRTEPRIDAMSATCLFRIAQESMNNAAEHGHAPRICVSLAEEDGWVELRVRDEGIGFSTDSPGGKGGLGLISMQERIRHVKGSLTLSSEPGKGALVIASVPVSGADHEVPQAADR